MRLVEKARTELVPENDPYPLPSTPQIITVTPDMASSWLSYRGGHPMLRPMSKSVSGKYQSLMERGLFREATPEGYIFDEEGWIISAQHRLKAQANGNFTLTMWVFPNQPRSIAPFLDQGLRRTAAHVIRVPHARDMGVGAKHLAALADGDRWGMPRFNRVLVPEVVETFKRWPELNWYPTETYAVQRAADIPAGPHLAVLAQAARTEHRLRIEPWLEGLRTGVDLHAGDPRVHLRNRFHRGLVTTGRGNKQDLTYALIVKAWNAYAEGERMTILRHMTSEPMPTVTGHTFERKGNAA